MATGLFNLKQVNQAIQQGGWPNPGSVSTYGAYFGGSGSGQYLTGPTTSALNFSTGSFTVEFWAFLSAYGGADLTIMFSASNASADFQFGASASSGVYWHNSGNQLTSNATAAPLGKWVHMALVRSGTTASLFCNGVRYSTTTNSAAVNLTNFNIGSYQASPTAYMTKGWISNLRITNTAVYDPTATTLTLPLTNLTAISGTQLLTLQNATIVDNSTNALTITNNGSVAMQTVAPFGLSNYKTPAVDYLVVAGGGGGGGCSSTSEAGGGGGAGGLLTGSVSVAAGTSYTVTVGAGGSALSGSTIPTNGSNSVFGNMIAVGGGYGGVSYIGSSVYSAGSGGSGGGGNGAVSGQSVNGGQGTANQGNRGGNGSTSGAPAGGGGGAGTRGLDFASSTYDGNGGAGIASVISGTVTTYGGGGGSGGTNSSAQSNGGVGGGGNGGTFGGSAATAGTANTGGGGGAGARDAGASAAGGSGIVILSYPDVYAAASAVTGATVSTSGSGSIYFDGTGDYLTVPDNSAWAFGSGNFTIEAWIYRTVNTVTQMIVAQSDNSTAAGSAWTFYVLNSNKLVSNVYYGSSYITLTSSADVPSNAWVHVALVRTSGTVSQYINGSRDGTSASLGSNSLNDVGQTVGIGANNAGNDRFTGYFSNVRIIKGSGPYDATASTLTVPTAPLTAITNTQLMLNTVSGAFFADASANSFTITRNGDVTWNQLSPFTVTGYKNRVYTWTSSGSITF